MVSVSSTLTSKTTIDLAIALTFSFFGWGFGFGLAASAGADSPKRSSSSSTTCFFGYSFLAYCWTGFPVFSIHFFNKSLEKLLMKRYQKWVLGYFPTSGSSEISKKVTGKIKEDLGIDGTWKSSFRKVGVWGEVWFDLVNVSSWESHQQIWDMIINVEIFIYL